MTLEEFCIAECMKYDWIFIRVLGITHYLKRINYVSIEFQQPGVAGQIGNFAQVLSPEITTESIIAWLQKVRP